MSIKNVVVGLAVGIPTFFVAYAVTTFLIQ